MYMCASMISIYIHCTYIYISIYICKRELYLYSSFKSDEPLLPFFMAARPYGKAKGVPGSRHATMTSTQQDDLILASVGKDYTQHLSLKTILKNT